MKGRPRNPNSAPQELAIKLWRDHTPQRFALDLFPVSENHAVADDACSAGAPGRRRTIAG